VCSAVCLKNGFLCFAFFVAFFKEMLLISSLEKAKSVNCSQYMELYVEKW